MAEISEKYEDELYGKVEFLHEMVNQKQLNLTIFSEIIAKFISALSDFSNSVDNIKNRRHKFIDNKDTTIYNLAHVFKIILKVHINEFKECSENLNKLVINNMAKNIDEKYIKEKELYNNYIKVKNIYDNSKIVLDKSKKDFDNSAKICEKNILTYYQLKSYDINSANKSAHNKNEERNKEFISTAKNFEDKYVQCLEEANKARENEITKQKELLNFYQSIDTEYFTKIHLMISYFLPMIKKMYTSILKSLEKLEEQCKKVNIKQDILNCIQKNKSKKKPDEKFKFIPYFPEANLESKISGNDKKDLELLDIDYNVILKLHENFREIRKDLNMEEEKEKSRLRYLCSQIFRIGPGVGFSQDEKNELLSLLKQKKHKSYFLVTLSKQRTKGRYKRNKKLLIDLSQILLCILEEAKKEKNYEDARTCIILSQTFYYEIKKGKEIIKKYLIEFIKKFNWFQQLEFWEGIINYMIQTEIHNNSEINKVNNYKENDEEFKNSILNISFSQILSYSSNMIDFMIKKEDIIKIVDKYVKVFKIPSEMAESIYDNIKNSQYPKEVEEDNDEGADEINKRSKTEWNIFTTKDNNEDQRTKSYNDDIDIKMNINNQKDSEKNDNKITEKEKVKISEKIEEKKGEKNGEKKREKKEEKKEDKKE